MPRFNKKNQLVWVVGLCLALVALIIILYGSVLLSVKKVKNQIPEVRKTINNQSRPEVVDLNQGSSGVANSLVDKINRQDNLIIKAIDEQDQKIGVKTGQVELIVYSDFTCHYCAKFDQVLKQALVEFKDDLVIAYRHFPLSGNELSNQAALAAECAGEQDQFWAMHDRLFLDAQAGLLTLEKLKVDASEVALNKTIFNKCLDEAKYQNKINEQLLEAKKLGVIGTPTSFLNGKVLPGAYQWEDFKRDNGEQVLGLKTLIQQEIAKNKK